VDAEAAKDKGDTGALAKLYCEYAYPENKQAKFATILEKGKAREMSNYEQENAMGGWKNERQKELLIPSAQDYFDKFLWVIENCDKEFAARYVIYLAPTYAGLEFTIEKLAQTIPTIPADQHLVIRRAKDKLDVLENILKGRKLSQAYIDSTTK
jgi:hypothetical protein